MLIIDDSNRCPHCGAYWQEIGFCANGHRQPMSANDLIEALRAAVDEHGDRPVVIEATMIGYDRNFTAQALLYEAPRAMPENAVQSPHILIQGEEF